jgi:7-keto-8-aminopelargonate synthetase-like enzyme
MTALRDFIDEIASELDARTDKPLAPHHWISFVKLLAAIDRDDELGELRQKMEQIVSQRDLRFQDRCLAVIPLLFGDPAIAAEFTRRRQAAITAVAAL